MLMKNACATPTSRHPWGVSIKLLRALLGGGVEVGGREAGTSITFHLPHLAGESHMNTRMHTVAHTVTGLAVGLHPHGTGGFPTALGRTAEIIPVLADSHRMLILSHLFYSIVKSGSSSQSLLLLRPPLPLTTPHLLYPSLSILPSNPLKSPSHFRLCPLSIISF